MASDLYNSIFTADPIDSVEAINQRAHVQMQRDYEDLQRFSALNSGSGAALPFSNQYNEAFANYKALRHEERFRDFAEEITNSIQSGDLTHSEGIQGLTDLKSQLLADSIYSEHPRLGAQVNDRLSRDLMGYYNGFKKDYVQRQEQQFTASFSEDAFQAANKTYLDPGSAPAYKQMLQSKAQAIAPLIGGQKASEILYKGLQNIDGAYLTAKIEQDPLGTGAELASAKDNLVQQYGYKFYNEFENKATNASNKFLDKLNKISEKAEKDIIAGKDVDLSDSAGQLSKAAQLTNQPELQKQAANLEVLKSFSDSMRSMGVPQLQQLASGKVDNDTFNTLNENIPEGAMSPKEIKEKAAAIASKRLTKISEDPHEYATNIGAFVSRSSVNYLDPMSLGVRAADVEKAEASLGVRIPLLNSKELDNLLTVLSNQTINQGAGTIAQMSKAVSGLDKMKFFSQVEEKDKTGASIVARLVAGNPQLLPAFERGAQNVDKIIPNDTVLKQQLQQALQTSDPEIVQRYVKPYMMYKKGAEGGWFSGASSNPAKDMLGVTKDSQFGEVLPPLPLPKEKTKTVLNSIKTYEGLIKHSNGIPRLSDGSILDIDDADLTLEPTAVPGKYYLKKDDRYVGASNFNVPRGQKPEIMGKFLVDLRSNFAEMVE